MKKVTVLFSMIMIFICAGTANAALFNVDFNDNTASHWTGVVNTTTDTLTFTSWTENAGFPTLLIPSLPMVWDAVDGTGSSFDVPDNWDGNFGTNWGFLSPVSFNSISFVNGTYNSTFTPGWHIQRYSDGTIATNIGTNRISPWPRDNGILAYADADTVVITAVVPIPGAVWLLGSGLIGLVGFRRKFTTS